MTTEVFGNSVDWQQIIAWLSRIYASLGATPDTELQTTVIGLLKAIKGAGSTPVSFPDTYSLSPATLAALEQITVANMIPAVETGLAKEVTLQSVLAQLDDASADTVLSVLKLIEADLRQPFFVYNNAATPVYVSLFEPVSVDDNGGSLTVDGSVGVSNFPATYPVTDNGGSLTVDDDYTGGQVLPDQVGAAGVLTFTFSSAVQLVVIDAAGSQSDVARADPFGGTPTISLGIPCRDKTPTYMPITTTVVKVWAPTNMNVSVWGYRR